MENLYTRGRDRVKPRGANQRQNYKKASKLNVSSKKLSRGNERGVSEEH